MSDLVRLLDHSEALPSWDLHLVVRRFMPLPPSSEFRCFVHQRRLTAISQYFARCFFEELQAQRAELQSRLERFVGERIGEIKLDSYIMDVAVLPAGYQHSWPHREQDTFNDRDNVHAATRELIIELNPFARTTGGCLFDWEVDGSILRAAEGPVEMRIVGAPQQHLDVCLMPWRDLLSQASQPPAKTRLKGKGEKKCTVL